VGECLNLELPKTFLCCRSCTYSVEWREFLKGSYEKVVNCGLYWDTVSRFLEDVTKTI
jgi:hypothetical protein